MTLITSRLHNALIEALKGAVESHGSIGAKPLTVDLRHPHPRLLRVYMYSLVGGDGERRRREYKVVLRTPGQPRGSYGTFDHTDRRFTLVVGYKFDLDVFVLWDAMLHPRFKNGGNLQVKDSVVRTAAALGRASAIRSLTSGSRELVLVCQSSNLLRALDDRVATAGGVAE